ncbi:MAG TPA: SDR family NAD(P)-dependent oxidoreductase, partial [Acidimicrobiales bacterium]
MQRNDGLDGRRAIVTGGARGIGAAIAATLADLGAEVTVLDLSGAEEAARQLPSGRAATVDLSDPEAIDAFVARSDGADIVVHCAGITRVERFVESDPSTWDAQ